MGTAGRGRDLGAEKVTIEASPMTKQTKKDLPLQFLGEVTCHSAL